MTSRALCGGARASRKCPSLGSTSLGVSLLCADLAATSGRLGVTPSMWRSAHSIRTYPLRPNEATRSSFTLAGASNARVNLWLGSGCRRSFSRTSMVLEEQDKAKGKGQVSPETSSKPTVEEPRGIRKVIPKVIPALTQHENIYTVPNLLTFSRLIAAPFIGYAIVHDAHTLALGLFAYAGFSDLLDGWIARRWKLQTVVGSVVDPMADKMLMTVLTVCLAYKGALPAWLAVIILGRDVGLGIAAIYYRWISLPLPKTFTRYWDFSLPSAEVRPTTISKYNTFLQLGLMGATMVTPILTADVGMAMTAFQYLVATTTVWSGLSYVFSKDAVRILSENKGKSKGK
ncbi:CDP-alcohol phosphatidyltransferase-domain-containing protein [Daldinia loculata]|nr:CDP-alcohol phosphatidyltransferase-domain-containing protein [Daldinia loculata]